MHGLEAKRHVGRIGPSVERRWRQTFVTALMEQTDHLRGVARSAEEVSVVRAFLENNPNESVAEQAGTSAADATVVGTVPNSSWPIPRIQQWLRERGIAFEGEDLETLCGLARDAEEERLAIEEEERAMAEWEAAQARRGQVISSVSTSGNAGTVLDTAREGEEIARRELMEAAEAAANRPVVVTGVFAGDAEPITPSRVVRGVEVVGAAALAVPAVAVGENVVPGGVPAMMNSLRL